MLHFHPSAVKGKEGLKKFESLLRTFHSLGGTQFQTNVVDPKILRAAQREPEKYRHLVIRVWGFSAYFVDLSKEYQEEIIERTVHGL